MAGKISKPLANSPKVTLEENIVNVREKLAEKANVGARTYAKGKKIASDEFVKSGQPYYPINPHNHKLKKEKTIMEKIKEITVQELVSTFEGKLADVSSDGDAMVHINVSKAHFGYDADYSELEIFTGNAVKEGYASITFRISEEDTVEVFKDKDGKLTYYLVFNDGRMDDLEIIDTMMPMDN